MEAGRTVSGGIMHGSQEALGMLSPMDGAADKLLKGDLGGAGNEAMLEAFGGRVFKAAGKGMAAVKRHAGQLDEAVGALSHADDAATATATGVRESIEEASSVLAKEGGGVAAKGGGGLVDDVVRAGGGPGDEIATGFRGSKGFELHNAPYQPMRNAAGEVNGRLYSGHAFDQMQNRGIMPSVVDNTIATGVNFPTRAGTTGSFDATNGTRVITNSETGRVITVIRGSP
jgi:nucleoid-associated protein YgaU